jgi:type 1 glutamine amidotransferase
MYLFECQLLAKCLAQTPGIETTVVDGWPKDPEVLRRADVLVTYSADAGSGLLAGPHRKEFIQLMERGVGLVALHWSTGCANNGVGPEWREILGGWFSLEFSRLAVTPARPRDADPGHPISRGWQDFDLRDEYYLDLRFHERMHPIVRVNIDGVDYPVAWTFERAKGRSFGFVCGHFHEVFLDPSYRRIAVNAILWAGHRDVPAEGSPVNISPADSVLPPEPPQAK